MNTTALRVLHNPRCSKSRRTLELLHAAGHAPEVVEYLKTPPSAAELNVICRALGREPQAILRYGEDIAKRLGLTPEDTRPRAEWLRLLEEHPVLIERPIVIAGDRAVIGRPPEAVQELLRR